MKKRGGGTLVREIVKLIEGAPLFDNRASWGQDLRCRSPQLRRVWFDIIQSPFVVSSGEVHGFSAECSSIGHTLEI